MSLSSIFQRFRRQASSESAAEATPLSPASVEEARVRARRRLIGMAVLVGAGVIGFPWLFETQPRPMSQDIQVVQAHGGTDGADEALAVTGAGRPARSASGKVSVAAVQPPPVEEEIVDARPVAKAAAHDEAAQPARHQASVKSDDARPDAGKAHADADKARAHAEDKHAGKPAADKPPAKPADKVGDKSADKAGDKPVAKPAAKPADKPAAKPTEKPVAKLADKATDKPTDKAKPADKDATRFVVQVGAFAESASAQATRAKIERLGVKTYAQEVSTPAGKRIRVRIGPYTDKAEADKALATLRKAGINGNVLTL